MEFKHTPGPWLATKYLDSKMNWVYAQNGAKNGGDIICFPPDMDESLENWPDNINLIAAAPELLEDLQMAYNLLKSINGKSFDEWPEAIKIKSTLEKATK